MELSDKNLRSILSFCSKYRNDSVSSEQYYECANLNIFREFVIDNMIQYFIKHPSTYYSYSSFDWRGIGKVLVHISEDVFFIDFNQLENVALGFLNIYFFEENISIIREKISEETNYYFEIEQDKVTGLSLLNNSFRLMWVRNYNDLLICLNEPIYYGIWDPAYGVFQNGGIPINVKVKSEDFEQLPRVVFWELQPLVSPLSCKMKFKIEESSDGGIFLKCIEEEVYRFANIILCDKDVNVTAIDDNRIIVGHDGLSEYVHLALDWIMLHNKDLVFNEKYIGGLKNKKIDYIITDPSKVIAIGSEYEKKLNEGHNYLWYLCGGSDYHFFYLEGDVVVILKDSE